MLVKLWRLLKVISLGLLVWIRILDVGCGSGLVIGVAGSIVLGDLLFIRVKDV